jgi:hypothetical protein
MTLCKSRPKYCGQKEQNRQQDYKAESKRLTEHHLRMDCRRESGNLNKAEKLSALDQFI